MKIGHYGNALYNKQHELDHYEDTNLDHTSPHIWVFDFDVSHR